MVEARPTDLIYGHLGDPTYDTHSQEWHFPRHISTSRHIEPVGPLLDVFGPYTFQDKRSYQYETEHQRQKKTLSDRYLDINPAPNVFSDAETSKSSEEENLSYDSTQARLLARAYATRRSSQRHPDKLPIIATAAGVSGELVKLTLLRKDQLGWQGNRTFGINHSTARGGEHGWWRPSQGTIQQICSSTGVAGEDGLFLAVRYGGLASILQPLLQSQSIVPSRSSAPQFRLPSSRLDAHEIIQIPQNGERRIHFADICFNPWDAQQVATIDQEGNWSIWDLEMVSKRRNIWSINRGANSSLRMVIGDFISPDQWAKVLWVHDFRTILLAGRRALSFVVLHREIKALRLPDLALAESDDWILDIQRGPRNASQFFLVTSTRLFWLNVTTIDEDAARPEVCFAPDSRRATSTTDPYILSLKFSDPFRHESPITQIMLRHSLFGIVLRPSSFHGVASSSSVPGFGLQYFEEGWKFYQLYALFANLTLYEGIYARPPYPSQLELHEPNVRTRAQVLKTPAKLLDDFIVSDENAYEEDFGVTTEFQTRPSLATISHEHQSESSRTLNFEWLMSLILVISQGHEPGKLVPTIADGDAFSTIRAAIESRESSDFGRFDTLYELTDTDMSVRDIDDVEEKLYELLKDTNCMLDDSVDSMESAQDNVGINIPQIPLSVGLVQPPPRESGLRSIYNDLLHSFLSPLPSTVPVQVRVSLERLIRSIALQLCLASYPARPRLATYPSDGHRQGLHDQPQQRLTFELPVRGKTFASTTVASQDRIRAAKPASPSKSAPDSSAEPSSPMYDSASAKTSMSASTEPSYSSVAKTEDPTSKYLRSLTSLAPQPVLPLELSSILEHWTLGADPDNYDWVATTQAQARDTEAEEVEASSSQRRKAKRRKRARESQLDWSSSQPVPEVSVSTSRPVSASQPTQMMGSSQPTGMQESGIPAFTMSQPTRGPDGSRIQKVKHSKPKKPGFN
ncbi:uncharacterized protein KY384_006987 [Bacidia gigantensis]|uniref:uncharacterized protein n=1 Tax=Bacidia gigantensis TaxID=2732470 RepID=UPI001D04D41A|nr:uncharacterized protein KY384_006987 [Bacidia gigantensis]KAG8528071.1 hypothetical protein KY384_006987 [Bacidia gigantensis]